MVDEIEGIGKKRKSEEPMVWKPWQPPPGFVPPVAKTDDAPAERKVGGPRLSRDVNGTGRLDWNAAARQMNLPQVDFDKIAVPGASGAQQAGSSGLGDAAKALGELGVVSSLSQVAVAYARTPVSFSNLADSLEAFATNLTKVTDQLQHVPGVGEALLAFGGVGGVVSGVMGFKEELKSIQQDGLNLGNGLGVAASAAQFVGGVATALGTVCPALAPVGASIMAAGAGLKLGKLAWENRDKVKAGVEAAGKVVEKAVAPIVGNNGAAIVSNNGANMVGGQAQGPWAWMTG